MPGPDDFGITPASIDRLAATLSILRWRLIYGLNLARGTPQAAADEAAYVAQAIGPRLLAFQIGNEPDGFGRWNKARPQGYDVDAFLADWTKFHAAICDGFLARVSPVPIRRLTPSGSEDLPP